MRTSTLFALVTAMVVISQASPAIGQTSTEIYYNDFDSLQPALELNATSRPLTGSNQWVINNRYHGLGGVPTTPNQFSTKGSGSIAFPNGNYLHITDGAGQAANSAFDANTDSEAWTILNTTQCFQGFDSVQISFWSTGGAGSSINAELWYTTNGGFSWNWIGRINSSLTEWQHDTFSTPGWSEKTNMILALKWENINSAGSDSLGIAIDDIRITGITNAQPKDTIAAEFFRDHNTQIIDTVCLEADRLQFAFSTQDSLCGNVYVIEIDQNPNFTNPLQLGFEPNLSPSAFFMTSLPPGIYLISAVLFGPFHTKDVIPGVCYYWRIRQQNAPYLTSEAAAKCIIFKACDASVRIASVPQVFNDPDMGIGQACVNSTIDQHFHTTGAYFPGNRYILEMSDLSGSFASPTTIANVADSSTYDPAIYPNPWGQGTLSGQVPNVPAGCGYTFRIRSTQPPGISDTLGPFCIQECPIVLNNHKPVTIITCHMDSTACIPIQFTGNLNFPPNQFELQILEAGSLTPVVQGMPFQQFPVDSSGTDVCINSYGYSAMVALGVIPGQDYLARMVSNTKSILGPLVPFRLHKLYQDPLSIAISPAPGTIVSGSLQYMTYTASPKHPHMQYRWIYTHPGGTDTLINNGAFAITSYMFGQYQLQVQEINGPCLGNPTNESFVIPKTTSTPSYHHEPTALAFPNPAEHEFHLVLPENWQGGRLAIFNQNGQLVIGHTLRPGQADPINIRSLSSGIYMWILLDEAGRSQAGKLVVAKGAQ